MSQATQPEILTAWGTSRPCSVATLAVLTLELGNVCHFTPHLLLPGGGAVMLAGKPWEFFALQETAEFPESQSLCEVAVN